VNKKLIWIVNNLLKTITYNKIVQYFATNFNQIFNGIVLAGFSMI